MLTETKRRAKLRSLAFALTEDWFFSRLTAGRCEVTGIEFDLRSFDKARRPFAPSIDRKDSSKGYTPDNCQMVVLMYNNAKSDATHKDVVRLAEALLEAEVLRETSRYSHQELLIP